MTTGYPSTSTTYPSVPAPSHSGSTASTMVLIAIGFQLLGVFLLLEVFYLFVPFSIFSPPYGWMAATAITCVFAGIILLILFAFFFSFRRIQRGDYAGAQTPTLVLGVLSILTLNIISGALFLIGYAKLGDAIRERQPPTPAPVFQSTMAPGTMVACKGCGRVFPVGAFSFCPNCGQKLGS